MHRSRIISQSLFICLLLTLLSVLPVHFLHSQTSDPRITSTPVTKVLAGRAYAYTVEATGTLPIVYSLVEKPAGMSIQASRGIIGWWPERKDMGVHTIRAIATNSVGSAEQSFQLEVNAPPLISDIPDATINASTEFQYQVLFSANPQPAFSISEGPAGLNIQSETGLISWTPTEDNVGTYTVRIKAANQFGMEEKSFVLEVRSTVSVEHLDSPTKFSVGTPFPQPASTFITVPVFSDRPTHAEACIYNLLGILVHFESVTLTGGSNHIRLLTFGFPSGQYFLLVHSNLGESFIHFTVSQ